MKLGLSKVRTLVCYGQYSDSLSYYEDWRNAFCRSAEFGTTTFDVCRRSDPSRFRTLAKDAELIVLLHSTNADTLDFLRPYEGILAQRACKLIVFVGNELNYPPPLVGMRDKIRFLDTVRPDFIATQLPLQAGTKLYEDVNGAIVVSIPHALDPGIFFPAIPDSQREIDIGVRSSRYHPYLGDSERVSLVEYFLQDSHAPSLVRDISLDYNDRLDPAGWAGFLNKCRGTLATEAGTYFLEKDDATVTRAAEHIRVSTTWLQRLSANLAAAGNKRLVPQAVRSGIKTLFKKVSPRRKYFGDFFLSGNGKEIVERFFKDCKEPLNGKCISSRHFEAIGTKTCQIMFPGEFNGILAPGRHYIALSRDFSDIQTVLAKFADETLRRRMTDEALEYVLDCHTYAHRMKQVRDLLD
ncbi:MAG: glycosyltransferase [Planctomycetota bacterium]|nr:glycosyltransferase [Planctomycetota bacterium]